MNEGLGGCWARQKSHVYVIDNLMVLLYNVDIKSTHLGDVSRIQHELDSQCTETRRNQ